MREIEIFLFLQFKNIFLDLPRIGWQEGFKKNEERERESIRRQKIQEGERFGMESI